MVIVTITNNSASPISNWAICFDYADSLVTKPQLILADEPTGNLDSENGTKVIELIRELKTPEQTVIMITHNPSLVKYASRVIEIKDGVIQK